MVSIILKMRKDASEFIENHSTMIKGDEEGKNWYHIPMYFKKVGENLFAEYSFEDLPEHIKKQIQKPEKVY